MVGPGRKALLCNQNPLLLTGIDFIRVNPADHRQLAVFFVVGPDRLTRPVNAAASEFLPRIVGLEDGSEIALAEVIPPALNPEWVVRADASGDPRLTLSIVTAEEGDFQTYRLALSDTPEDAGSSRLDPFCDALAFSFKQACPSPFDCEPSKDCPEAPVDDYPVDYLARDFESLRRALLTYASDRYPDWSAQVPADFGGMVAELFAALGDEFSYIQDRFQREGYLATLTQRRSFAQLARLVDYRLDPGQAATGLVVMRLYADTTRPAALGPHLIDLPAGARLWADQEDRPPVPFEVGETLAQMIAADPAFPLHTHWTDLPAYVPDPQRPCLEIGARQMFLADEGLLTAPFPAAVLAIDIAAFWAGRQLLIETRPVEPDAPVRRHLVTLDEPVERLIDPLIGAGPILRLHWRAEDALAFELDQTQAFVSANLVPVRAGQAVSEAFVTGQHDDPALADLPRSVERHGPARDGARPAIHRFTLAATVERGLGWQTATDAAGAVSYVPDAAMAQIDLDAGGVSIADWTVGNDALALAATDEAATVEAGRYGPVQNIERLGVRYIHRDYIDDRGFTLRFGDGVFGRQPTAGDVFRVTYRTGPGRAANVPADTITRMAEPPGTAPPLQSLPPGPTTVQSVRNPFAITNGRDPQALELARRIAPAAYKALVFRAVRDEDYRAQAERLDWVQEAGAVTRWTGGWASTFVSADPRGAFEISDARLEELRARLGAVRQVARCVIARQPVFLPLDIKIAVCLEDGCAFGDVAARVIAALSPRANGFFRPDHFSFGDPLLRPALEAAITCIEGVRSVLQVQLRIRGRTAYFIFDTPELAVADNRILKMENDPNRPGQGSIRVYADAIPEMEGA